jgi:hypothetical protein
MTASSTSRSIRNPSSPVKLDRNRNLAANAQAALSQFVGQRDFVHGFQQAWTQLGVNLVGGVHNLNFTLH